MAFGEDMEKHADILPDEAERLKDLDADLCALRPYVDRPNIFEIAGIAQLELPHSNMLAWLMDPAGSHGLGGEFLARVADLVAQACGLDDSAAFANTVRDEANSFVVMREWQHTDILAYSNVTNDVICIENKIKAPETVDKDGNNQLERYPVSVAKAFPGHNKLFAFLTPDGHESSYPELWSSIGYEEILEAIERAVEEADIEHEQRMVIQQYVSAVRRDVLGADEELVNRYLEVYGKHHATIHAMLDQVGDLWTYVVHLCRKWRDCKVAAKLASDPHELKGWGTVWFKTPLCRRCFQMSAA